MIHRLTEANLFYFCGIWEMSEVLRHALRVSPLVEHLRARIQYNQMSFFGVCGGAMMAGANTQYGCPGLDLFDSNGGAAKVKTNFEDQVMQMTTGCALAVVMTYDNLAASSFITIKNGSQWLEFAASNTEAMQSLASKAAEGWKTYQSLDDQCATEKWVFN